MNHVGTQTIITDRLILRRFTMDDAATMFKNWANDPDVTEYLTWPPHIDVEVSKECWKIGLRVMRKTIIIRGLLSQKNWLSL
jgi:[ribosomal protein S5]-alanine N-acetyltransferase